MPTHAHGYGTPILQCLGLRKHAHGFVIPVLGKDLQGVGLVKETQISQGKPTQIIVKHMDSRHADKSRKSQGMHTQIHKFYWWALRFRAGRSDQISERPAQNHNAHKQNQSICAIFFGWPLDGFACISHSTTYQGFTLDKQPPSKSRPPPPPKELDDIMALAGITDLGSSSPARSALAMYATMQLH